MPISKIHTEVEIEKCGKGRVGEVGKTSVVYGLNQRVVDGNGQKNYPGRRPTAKAVGKAEEEVCDGTDHRVRNLKPEFNLALFLGNLDLVFAVGIYYNYAVIVAVVVAVIIVVIVIIVIPRGLDVYAAEVNFDLLAVSVVNINAAGGYLYVFLL